jgi:hypothetical protein
MKKHGVLPDVYVESFRSPTTGGLNCSKISTGFGQRSRSARSERLTGYLFWEEGAKSFNEPVSCGNRARRGEPKLRVEREAIIPRGEISKEGFMRVCGSVIFLNENCVPFEKGVCFVRRKEKGELRWEDRN